MLTELLKKKIEEIEKTYYKEGPLRKFGVNEHDFFAAMNDAKFRIYYIEKDLKENKRDSIGIMYSVMISSIINAIGYATYYTSKENLKRQIVRSKKYKLKYLYSKSIEDNLDYLGITNMEELDTFECSHFSGRFNGKEEYREDAKFFYEYYREQYPFKEYLEDLYNTCVKHIEKIDFPEQDIIELSKVKYGEPDYEEKDKERLAKINLFRNVEYQILKMIGTCEFYKNYQNEFIEIKEKYINEDYNPMSRHDRLKEKFENVVSQLGSIFQECGLENYIHDFQGYKTKVKTSLFFLKELTEKLVEKRRFNAVSYKEINEDLRLTGNVSDYTNTLLGYAFLYTSPIGIQKAIACMTECETSKAVIREKYIQILCNRLNIKDISEVPKYKGSKNHMDYFSFEEYEHIINQVFTVLVLDPTKEDGLYIRKTNILKKLTELREKYQDARLMYVSKDTPDYMRDKWEDMNKFHKQFLIYIGILVGHYSLDSIMTRIELNKNLEL